MQYLEARDESGRRKWCAATAGWWEEDEQAELRAVCGRMTRERERTPSSENVLPANPDTPLGGANTTSTSPVIDIHVDPFTHPVYLP